MFPCLNVHVRRKFTVDRMVSGYLAVYNQIVGK